MKKLLRIFKNRRLILHIFIKNLKIFRLLPDKIYLKINYKLRTGETLYLENPKSFNEKIQWLKINDKNPEYPTLVDKYKVREHIKTTIGEKYLIPLIGVYDTFEEIDFNNLPNQFVMKPNHTSGDVYICRDKSLINYSKLKKEVDNWLKKNLYWTHREWAYKNVTPKIVVEKLLVDESEGGLKDYKFFCFDGEPKIILVDIDRNTNHKRNLYNLNWEFIPGTIVYPNAPRNVKKPENLNKMIELAKTLSKDYPHVRTDFYSIDNQIYFGELTLYPGAGYEIIEPKNLELDMGGWIKLPK